LMTGNQITNIFETRLRNGSSDPSTVKLELPATTANYSRLATLAAVNKVSTVVSIDCGLQDCVDTFPSTLQRRVDGAVDGSDWRVLAVEPNGMSSPSCTVTGRVATCTVPGRIAGQEPTSLWVIAGLATIPALTLGPDTNEYQLGALSYTGTPGAEETICTESTDRTSSGRTFFTCTENTSFSQVNYLRRLTISIPSAVFRFSDASNRPLIYLPGSQRTAPIGYESGDRL
jgi:hypothetical protein